MTRALVREDGFTIVELLVSISISMILVFATLGGLDVFSSGSADSTRLIVSEDQARSTVQRVVGVLRNAGVPSPLAGGAQPATILAAAPNDIVFRSSSWPGESGVGVTGTHVVRLCLDTAARTLWFDGLHVGTAGPTDPGAACPSTATGWTHKPMATNVLNDVAQPVFRYDGGTPVRSVGLSLRLEGGTTAESRPISLHSGGVLRGALAPQVTAGDISIGPCEAGKALLTLLDTAGGATADGAKIAATNAITTGPGQILIPATTTPVDVGLTITNVLGLQTLLIKQVKCP
jgi:hypothetical protein